MTDSVSVHYTEEPQRENVLQWQEQERADLIGTVCAKLWGA